MGAAACCADQTLASLIVKANSEFLFIRPNNVKSRNPPGYLAKYEKFLDHVYESGSSSIQSLEKTISWAFEKLGNEMATAIWLWGCAVHTVKTGAAIQRDLVKEAICATVTCVEHASIKKPNTPKARLALFMACSADYVEARSEDPLCRMQAMQCAEHIRIVLEANAGNVVYRDSFLLVSWRNCLGMDKPELFVCTRNQATGIFTYLPNSVAQGCNMVPPISSFKAAKKAVQGWRGQRLTGDLMGSAAIRLCNIIGIEVKNDKAVIRGNHHCAKGF